MVVGDETTADVTALSSMVLDGGSPAEYEFYFTGAHFGLFNQTVDGENGLCPAHFTWASFEEHDMGAEAKVSAQQVSESAGLRGHRMDGTVKELHGSVNGSLPVLVQ